MGRKKWRYLGAVLAAVMLLPMTAEASSADGSNVVYEGYTYDFYGNAKESPAAFVLERTIDAGNMNGTALSGVDDVCTSKDGRILSLIHI